MKKLILMFLVSFVSAVVFAGDWFMAQTNSADLYSVGASSELVEAQYDGKYLYPPINVLDGNFDTVWCEAEKVNNGSTPMFMVACTKAPVQQTERLRLQAAMI